jgi:hypothetical protein
MRLLPPLLLCLAGCDLFGTVRPSGKPVSEAYGGSHELRVLDVESPLKAQKKIPVLSTPEVFAVYVPSHAERDVMVGEHWYFLKLRDAEWYVDRLREPDPPPRIPVLRRARAIGFRTTAGIPRRSELGDPECFGR